MEKKRFNREQKLKTCQERLIYLSTLERGWNGYGAAPVSKKVILNCKQFIKVLPDSYLRLLNVEEISPSTHGTITIDWETSPSFVVSIEIGKNNSGFFAELPDGSIPYNDNLGLISKNLPVEFSGALSKLYFN